eukprot:gene7153-14567_t
MSVTWQMYVEYMKARGNIDECMIVDAEDGAHWASTPDFILREYSATIAQEDGTEKEEIVNEAKNLLQLMAEKSRPPQGLRLNGGKKQQILRAFQDDEANAYVAYGKIMKGGCGIFGTQKCILVGTFDETKGHTSAACNNVLTEVAKHLAASTWPTSELSLSDSGSSGPSGAATWMPYIQTMLVAKGHIQHALICSKTDGTLFAATPGFELKTYETEIPQEDGTDKMETVNEAANLAMLMKGGAKPAQGLRINGEKKYQILRAFEEEDVGFVVYGKKMKGGCCVAVSNTAIIVGVFDESKGHTSAGCNTVVTDLFFRTVIMVLAIENSKFKNILQ